MSSLMTWLLKVEKQAHIVYRDCSEYFSHDAELSEFLKLLSNDELGHYTIMEKVLSSGMSAEAISVELSDDFTERFDNNLKKLYVSIEKGSLQADELLKDIIEAELSEWNELFVFSVKQYAKSDISRQVDISMMQRHIDRITIFLERSGKYPELISRLAMLQKVWDYHILIVDDEAGIRDLLAMVFGRQFRVVCASDGCEAIELMKRSYFDMIISDVDMPCKNGEMMYHDAVQNDEQLRERIIYMTGAESHVPFFKKYGLRYFMKPFKIDLMRQMVYETIVDRR